MPTQTPKKPAQQSAYRIPWGISIRIPKLIIFHLCIGSPALISLRTQYRGWAHYGWRRCIGRIERTFVGEPNYYDDHGNCIGYSRKAGLGRYRHFDHRGNPVGQTFCLLWILMVHIRQNPRR